MICFHREPQSQHASSELEPRRLLPSIICVRNSEARLARSPACGCCGCLRQISSFRPEIPTLKPSDARKARREALLARRSVLYVRAPFPQASGTRSRRLSAAQDRVISPIITLRSRHPGSHLESRAAGHGGGAAGMCHSSGASYVRAAPQQSRHPSLVLLSDDTDVVALVPRLYERQSLRGDPGDRVLRTAQRGGLSESLAQRLCRSTATLFMLMPTEARTHQTTPALRRAGKTCGCCWLKRTCKGGTNVITRRSSRSAVDHITKREDGRRQMDTGHWTVDIRRMELGLQLPPMAYLSRAHHRLASGALARLRR
ncbi:hypothetical protein GY45DRAFT_227684 [Cubamyces sp. BRFM 1775]|nr:hypothetical protein GY45DRAFT_227684 [Cubamyces sp. BRFM 1775]